MIGAGRVSLALSNSQTFTMEVVCKSCRVKYACCSDCGGGGNGKTYAILTVSLRTRNADITADFADLVGGGMLPFSLSRLLAEPSSQLHRALPRQPQDLPALPHPDPARRLREIPDADKPEITATIRQLYFNNRLSVIARPDMLERGDGLARTFVQVEKSTVDVWHLHAPMTCEDVEESRGLRRCACSLSKEGRIELMRCKQVYWLAVRRTAEAEQDHDGRARDDGCDHWFHLG